MPTKRKKSKSAKNIEEQIDNIEKNVEILEKISKDEKKKERQKQIRNKKTEEKIEKMREDLQNQLINQNKFGEQFNDMIEHYLFLVTLIDELEFDIKTNGLRYEVKTGNGYAATKPNESVKNISTISSEMRKILQDLNLKEPEISLEDIQNNAVSEEGEGDDLL